MSYGYHALFHALDGATNRISQPHGQYFCSWWIAHLLLGRWIPLYFYIYIYICSPPHDLPQWSPMKILPDLCPWPTFDHLGKTLLVLFAHKKVNVALEMQNFWQWQDGKKQVLKAFDLQKNVVTRKCCLQVTICLEDKIFPQIRNTILARKLSCVEQWVEEILHHRGWLKPYK